MNSRRSIALPLAVLMLAGCSSQMSPGTTVPAVANSAANARVPVGAPDMRARTLLYAGGPTQNLVGVYPGRASNPAPLRVISGGLNAPTGIAVDTAGNAYVCNNAGVVAGPRGKGTWTVTVYHRGKRTPFESYTNGVWNPVDVAIAADGTVFIANYSSAVTVYPPNSLDPSRTLVGPTGQAPLGIAFDAAGNTFVSYVNPSSGGSIFEYAPGQNTGSNLGITFSGSPHGLAVDRAGNLVVAVSKAPNPGGGIEIFAPGKTTPKQTITGLFQPFMLTFSSDGRRLFAADFGSGNGDGGVFKFAYPSGTLLSKYTQGPAGSAYGVAVGP